GEPAYKKVAERRAKEAATSTAPATAASQAPQASDAPQGGAAKAVAAAEASAAAQAAAYKANQQRRQSTSSPLLFTPFPDPLARMRDWMRPTTRAPPAPVTPDPDAVERQRVQNLAKAAFEQTIQNSRQESAQLRHRIQLAEEEAEAKMKLIAERKHVHPTGAPPSSNGFIEAQKEMRSRIEEQRSFTRVENREQESNIEAMINEKVRKALRSSLTKNGGLKKLAPATENAFNEDDDDDVEEAHREDEKTTSSVRRSLTSPADPSTTTPFLIKPPTTYNNLFHNVPSNSEPRPFSEVKSASDPTTVAIVFHEKHSDTVSTTDEDPSASVFHKKDPLPITQFLEDHEAIDTLSSIDVEQRREEAEEKPVLQLQQGFIPAAAEGAGPFESLLKEAQEHLKESQKRVDELIKDQRLKIEREEKERSRMLEERRRKIEEQRRMLEERKKRRELKRKERLARQRLLAEQANDAEWSRRLDQEVKVKALEDSTRLPANSLEDDTPITTSKPKKHHHKKHRTTTTAEPEEDEEGTASAEATSAKPKRKQSRHAKNELDSDSYEAYEQWLRWREKRRLARRKLAVDSAAEE
ncbi:hypothetical protein PENTCL1PPCAC_30351, partial [Pristionchus entomophagus]